MDPKINQDEKETEEEVADYDSYDDYDDEFSATLKDLDNILDSKDIAKETVLTEEIKTTDSDIKTEAVVENINAEPTKKEETIESSNVNSEDNVKIDENVPTFEEKASENVAHTETIDEAFKENILNSAHETIDIPNIPVNEGLNNIEANVVNEEVETPNDNVQLPEVTLPDIPPVTETPVFVDTNGDLSLEQPEQLANEETATKNTIEQEVAENVLEEQTSTENAPKEEDPGFFSGWFGSGAGSDNENTEQENEQNVPEENPAAETLTEPENLPDDINENPGLVGDEANINPVDTFADIPELNPRAADNDAESLGQTPEMTNDLNVVDMPQGRVQGFGLYGGDWLVQFLIDLNLLFYLSLFDLTIWLKWCMN